MQVITAKSAAMLGKMRMSIFAVQGKRPWALIRYEGTAEGPPGDKNHSVRVIVRDAPGFAMPDLMLGGEIEFEVLLRNGFGATRRQLHGTGTVYSSKFDVGYAGEIDAIFELIDVRIEIG